MDSDEDQQALAWQQIIRNRAFYNVRVRRGESWVDAACRTLDELIDQKEQAEKSLSEEKSRSQFFAARADKANGERDEWKVRAASAVTFEQRNAVADHLWNAMVGSAKSVVRDVVAQAFVAAGIEVAVEAEQTVDPIEEKARELYRAATPDARWETVADEYHRIARHVLGQEDRHVNQ
mgnify:CR=1 FL=1